MRKCVTCEGYLEDSHFVDGGPICQTCVIKLYQDYHIDYTPPVKESPRVAVVNLIVAIKEQAIHDAKKGRIMKEDIEFGGPLEAWTTNWINAEPWNRIWRLIHNAEEERLMESASVKRFH